MKTIFIKEQESVMAIDPSFIGVVKLRPNGSTGWRVELTFKSGEHYTLLFNDNDEALKQYRYIVDSMEGKEV